MADQTPKDEKTEEATAHKLDQTREKGQVAFSTETMAAAGLLLAVIGFLTSGGLMASNFGEGLRAAPVMASTLGRTDLDNVVVSAVLGQMGRSAFVPLLAIAIPILIGSLIVGAAQAGLRISPKAIAADLNKLNPIQGATRMVNMRGWAKVGFALAKMTLLCGAVFVICAMNVPNLLSLGMTDLGPMMVALGKILFVTIITILVIVIALALIDYLFQRQQFSKEQRMSKHEIKEETKQTEGDPHLKARIRQTQREMANNRMMADVPAATAVVTNPTHYAVAISYPRDAAGVPTLDAPIVVAKGVDFMAQRIKKVARENGVLCHENRPLARALHADVEVGQPIPEDLYAAMATVLAHVYRADKAVAPALA
ncbi:MAG: flagellar type III secretion system protein FlhB [Planctomycetota bacterium]|nr:flagellar type III secretion system protein FlhB [Planctomycetota bacterium]MDG2143222.1 flagellar type III secretion system protein FlhB [Planctomycetota bacterium]